MDTAPPTILLTVLLDSKSTAPLAKTIPRIAVILESQNSLDRIPLRDDGDSTFFVLILFFGSCYGDDLEHRVRDAQDQEYKL